MLQVRINGDEIKQLQAGTSKDKYREILHCLHIERKGDMVEFVTTDGSALVRLQRPLTVYGDKIDEGVSLNIDLSSYKINAKYIYHIIEENNKLYFIGPDIKAEIIPKALKFPNYNVVVDGFEKLSNATEFAIFSLSNMKILWTVFDSFDCLRPKAYGARKPHFWTKNSGENRWLVCLMPMVA